MKNASRLFQILAVAGFAVLVFSGSAMAFGGYLTSFNNLYKPGGVGSNSGTNASCNLCHSSGGGTDLNPYGEAFAAAGHAFPSIQTLNSDGVSGNNIEEITASAQPGWTSGPNNTLYDIMAPGTGTVIAVNQNPPSGIINLDPAAPPPTTTTTTTPTTTSTTRATTTTTTAPPTTTTAPPTTTTAPTTTSTTRATTTTTAPTTSSTTRATTTTTRPTTTTTTRATTTTTRPTTTTTRRTTTTTRRTTTTTASTTTTTLPSLGATLYNNNCAYCHDGAALGAAGRNIVGARSCSIEGAINGTSVFPNGVPDMQFLQGLLSAADIQAIADSLNSNPATGQQRYITACAGCHGMDARGGRVSEGVKGASAGDILEAIHEERPMGYLGCLPASDVKDIGSYLKGTSREGGKNREGGKARDDRKRRD